MQFVKSDLKIVIIRGPIECYHSSRRLLASWQRVVCDTSLIFNSWVTSNNCVNQRSDEFPTLLVDVECLTGSVVFIYFTAKYVFIRATIFMSEKYIPWINAFGQG